MKLTLTLPELEAGERIARISDKQMDKIKETIANRIPVATRAILPMGDGVTLVFLKSAEKLADKRTKISLRPVPQKAFQVINARTKELVQLTVQFPSIQMTFDRDGERTTNYSVNGHGVNPETDPSPVTLLAKLMDQDSSNPIVRRCANYISLMR